MAEAVTQPASYRRKSDETEAPQNEKPGQYRVTNGRHHTGRQRQLPGRTVSPVPCPSRPGHSGQGDGGPSGTAHLPDAHAWTSLGGSGCARTRKMADAPRDAIPAAKGRRTWLSPGTGCLAKTAIPRTNNQALRSSFWRERRLDPLESGSLDFLHSSSCATLLE